MRRSNQPVLFAPFLFFLLASPASAACLKDLMATLEHYDATFAAQRASEKPLMFSVSGGAARAPVAGDTVDFGLKTIETWAGEPSRVHGEVKRVIVDDQGNAVGLVIARRIITHVDTGETAIAEPAPFLFRDMVPERASIASTRDVPPPPPLKQAEMALADHSGPYMARIGRSAFQAPISVGDNLSFLYTPPSESAPRVAHGPVKAILRDEAGHPTGLRITMSVPGKHDLQDVDLRFDQIHREDTRIDVGVSPGSMSGAESRYLKMPHSSVRVPWVEGRHWLRSAGDQAAVFQDSGSAMFPLSHEGGFQAPLAPGDEFVFHLKRPGKPMGFSYERELVEKILFDDKGVATGFTYFSDYAKKLKTVLFSEVDASDSYIATHPLRSQANNPPGSAHKKAPFTGRRQTTGNPMGGLWDQLESWIRNGRGKVADSEGQVAPPWSRMPTLFEEWEKTLTAPVPSPARKFEWACWVLKVAPDATEEQVTRAQRELSKRFHPDRRAQNGLTEEDAKKASQAINVAVDELKKARR